MPTVGAEDGGGRPEPARLQRLFRRYGDDPDHRRFRDLVFSYRSGPAP